jgi:hypothetical protein
VACADAGGAGPEEIAAAGADGAEEEVEEGRVPAANCAKVVSAENGLPLSDAAAASATVVAPEAVGEEGASAREEKDGAANRSVAASGKV